MLHRSSSFGILAKAVQNYYQTEKWRADLFQGGIKDISRGSQYHGSKYCTSTQKMCKRPKKMSTKKCTHRLLPAAGTVEAQVQTRILFKFM